MRKLSITLVALVALISLSACLEHEHGDGSHTHDDAPTHHDSID
jgi:hypothetical protein